MVKEGEEAPNFELKDNNGGVVKLSDYRGRWIVLYFFPKAFTSGCTIEAREFSRLWDEFEEMSVIVLGISTDPVETQRKFAEKYGVRFKLLSDYDKSVSKAYGVLRATGTAERVTFIINPEGKIVKVIKGVKPNEHPLKALEYLRAVIKGN
ncbi:peroxiredoxin [Caldivirga sp. UBA161]|uniref:peroxiredoxin n=1 Tax=Caldivirga sp. UBA161 TaxID=1915569 RepID=UPI0025C024CE|nr:peroxiredoxin [Caldivirga sp. UBA161]